jgi:hypothetical protein
MTYSKTPGRNRLFHVFAFPARLDEGTPWLRLYEGSLTPADFAWFAWEAKGARQAVVFSGRSGRI